MVFGTERPTSFHEALLLAKRILTNNHDLVKRGTVDREAELIVQAAYEMICGTRLSRMDLFSRMADRFPELAGEKVIIIAHGRAEGRILQHLIGRETFLDHEYDVSPSVLVPRPETELLARTAIDELHRVGRPVLGLEVGLGSGILSIELLAAFPELKMISSELSPEAARIARLNAGRILKEGTSRLSIVQVSDPGDVLASLASELGSSRADFLISNPPYMHPSDSIDEDVKKHEPHSALFPASGDPMHFYSEIARSAARLLKPAGRIYLELPAERAEAIDKVMQAAGWRTTVHADLNGFLRVMDAQRE